MILYLSNQLTFSNAFVSKRKKNPKISTRQDSFFFCVYVSLVYYQTAVVKYHHDNMLTRSSFRMYSRSTNERVGGKKLRVMVMHDNIRAEHTASFFCLLLIITFQ